MHRFFGIRCSYRSIISFLYNQGGCLMRVRSAFAISAFLRIIVFFLLVFAHVDRVSAKGFDIDFGFMAGQPTGDFSEEVDRDGYGFSVEGVYRLSFLPFGVGFEFGWMNYGHESRKEPLSPTIPDLRVRVVNNNNIISSNILLRFQPYEGRVTPFIDGILGLKYLYTETHIEDVDSGPYNLSSKNYDDTAFQYGIGGGTFIRLVRIKNFSKKDQIVDFSLNCRMKYMKGRKADYLTKKSIIRNGTDVTYDVKSSNTDMLFYHVGLALQF